MTSFSITRRALLGGLAALAAGLHAPLRAPLRAYEGEHMGAHLAELPGDLGLGRTVAVVGAGLAGLTAAWYLTRAGFEVTVLEADRRYGGRSLTVRPEADAYRRYFRERHGIGEETYVDRFAERDGPEQVCTFFDDGWDPDAEAHPQELFLNAGPGRIPSFHVALIDLCRELGVELEPFIFASRANLLQADGFNGGKPVPIRRVKHDLRGEMAELLAKLVEERAFDGHLSPAAVANLRGFLTDFGALEESGAALVYEGTDRAGYAVLPGAWRNAGKLNPVIGLEDLLASELWGDGGLYNDMRIYWQTSLMQPMGGMDMIWQHLLRQPAGAAGTVRDLVRLGAPVTAIENAGADGIAVTWGAGMPETRRFDLCISTMAPSLLANVLGGFPARFVSALSAVTQTSACKVGWQARTRFWETEDQIFGGISWTRHPISQIWYPADGYLSRTGVITGAYNRGAPAEAFARLSHAERLELALEGGERLHPGFRDKVYADRGVSIAWENMPHQVGGWADHPADTQPDIYHAITELPQGRLYLAGDFVSHMPGWMEGSVRSAQLAVRAIAERTAADKKVRP